MIRFQEDWYRNRYPHVVQEVEEGLWPSAEVHYFQKGSKEGLSPSPYFDEQWYRSTYPDIAYAINQQFHSGLHHYLLTGAREGRSPGPAFDENSYLAAHPDVAAAVAREEFRCGYEHFLLSGEFEGRTTHVDKSYDTRTVSYTPAVQEMPMFSPLCVEVVASKSSQPRLNLVLPSLEMAHMSGGPNTALNLVSRLAFMGIPMRFLSANLGVEKKHEFLWEHIQSLTGIDPRNADIELADASNPQNKAAIGENDVFFGTAWWTVQMIAPILAKMRSKTFLYLIQDYEPGLSAWSTEHSMALETYTMEMVPVVNSYLLRDYLIENRVGRFKDRNFASESLAFEPAIDRNFFFPEPRQSGRPNRLLFYARPKSAHRNLFELGLCALHHAAQAGIFSDGNWDLRFIGDPLPDTNIGAGVVIKAAPWMSYSGYARLMRNSDLLLSLMLSPHPSYPPLEMAACGGVVVTNSYASKTQERLTHYGSNILASEPTVKALREVLERAVGMVTSSMRRKSETVLPSTWANAFEPILPKLFHICKHMLDQGSLPATSVQSLATSPASSQSNRATILYPGDWEVVGARPEIYVAWSGRASEIVLRIFSRVDFFACGGTDAAIAFTIPLRYSGSPGVFIGQPQEDLPENDYIVAVTPPDSRTASFLQGIRIHKSEDVWPARFKQMIDHQASYVAAHRSTAHKRPQGAPVFSITTTVYNTPPSFVEELCNCIWDQSFDDFEWLILDNGCTLPEVKEVLRAAAARDARIRLFTVANNLHIIGGNRYLLERARGEYIVPVDSDDLVYPDALAVINSYIEANAHPDLLFSDEQKISLLGAHHKYMWRPEWSPLHAQATCPASHLMIFKRSLALQVEAYTGDYARGSHDWDTALRLLDFGVRGIHIPEVLYGWRMHPSSAAMDESSKAYLAESQINVVRQSLVRRGLADHMDVEPALSSLGYYHVVSQSTQQPPVLINIILPDCSDAQMKRLHANVDKTRYPNATVRIYVPSQALPREFKVKSEVIEYSHYSDVLSAIYRSSQESFAYQAILHNDLEVIRPDWLLDAITVFALDHDENTGIVGGCITTSEKTIQHIGYVAGLDGFFATPGYGLPRSHVYGALAMLRRHVTAVYGSFLVVRNSIWNTVGQLKGFDTTDGLYGIEFCLRARELGVLTAYTPRMAAVAEFQMQHPAGSDAALREEIIRKYGDSIERDPYYSAECSRSSKFYGLVTEI